MRKPSKKLDFWVCTYLVKTHCDNLKTLKKTRYCTFTNKVKFDQSWTFGVKLGQNKTGLSIDKASSPLSLQNICYESWTQMQKRQKKSGPTSSEHQQSVPYGEQLVRLFSGICKVLSVEVILLGRCVFQIERDVWGVQLVGWRVAGLWPSPTGGTALHSPSPICHPVMTGALQLEVGAEIAAKIFQVPCKEIKKNLDQEGFGMDIGLSLS